MKTPIPLFIALVACSLGFGAKASSLSPLLPGPLLLGQASATPPPANPSVPVISANSFLNSLSVCSHMGQGLDDPAKVGDCLKFTGIRNVRDDGSTNPATVQKFLDVHAASGAKFSLLPPSAQPADWPTMYDAVADAGALLAVEGTNEPNNEPPTFGGEKASVSTTFMPVAKYQQALYSFAKSDSHLSGIPVFASSEAGGPQPDNCGLQYLTIPDPAPDGVLMPSGTQYADYANAHNYIIGNAITAPVDNICWKAEDPTLNSNWDGLYGEYGRTWNKKFAGYSNDQLETLPRVTTETGWYTAAENAQGQKYPVTPDQQGKMLLNLYLTASKRGWTYTFVYYLHDSPQGEWGFYNADYTPKPSANYLHNLSTLISDTKDITPQPLNYTIANEPATVHDLLIEKSDGTYYLAVWDDRPVGEGTDSATVDLGGTYTVNQYDPTVGTDPTSLGKVSTATLSLSDHPLILEIKKS